MSNENSSKAKLFAKVAKVMASVRTLPKDGENKFDKYNYITGDAVFERIGKAMSDANLVALPSIVDIDTTTGESGSGKQMLRTVVHGQITLADADSGESWTSDWYGEGTDRGDKSINKAMTAMMKYFLLRLFSVGSGEDADEESNEAPKPASKPTQAPQRQLNATPTPSASNGAAHDNEPSANKSKAFKAFMAEGTSLFNGEWNNARHWVIELFTKKNTPTSIRTSANELTDDELSKLAESMRTSAGWFKTEWQKAKQAQPVKEAA